MELKLRNTVLPIILINIVCFIIQNMSESFTTALMLVSSDVLFRPWTLITSMFLHSSGMHILFNMYALFLFGTLIEQRIGTKRFLMLYFGSGILAGLGYAFFQEVILGATAAAIGASGGMMGVLGMTIVLLPHMRVLFFFVVPMSMRTAGIIFAMVDILGVLGIGRAGIANIAHLVGLGAGVLYGVYLLKEKSRFVARVEEKSHRAHSAHSHGTHKAVPKKGKETQVQDYSKSIELSKEEIDEYIRSGRL